MKWRFLLASAVLAVVPNVSTADRMHWPLLENACAVMGKSWCEAYALGAVQALENVHLVCPDHVLSGADGLNEARAYAAAHPDVALEGIAGFIDVALVEKYPCKGTRHP